MEEKGGITMENKNDKSKNIIIVILIIMIIGLAGLICYDKFIVKKENEKPASTTEKKEETTKAEDKEVDITDQNLKKDLSDKVSILDRSIDDRYPSSRRTIYNLEGITDNQKLRVTLMGSINKVAELTSEEKKKVDVHAVGKISVNDVETIYKKMFGTSISSYEDKTMGCPVFEYNKQQGVYYLLTGCNGLPDESDLSYINRLTQKGNEAYAYVNIGTLYHDYNNGGKKIIYDDITRKVVIATDVEDNYKIDETNYKKFTEYKYTFTKDSTGNYYFTKIEKINK